MSTTNKIPSNNSLIELKSFHNELIDNSQKSGYYNLIANGRFETYLNTTKTPKFLHWNLTYANGNNHGLISFNSALDYSREISISERQRLNVGDKIIFSICYYDDSNSGLITMGNCNLCGVGLTFIEIPDSNIISNVGGRQIIIKNYETTLETLVINNFTLGFSLVYSGSDTARILNCAMYQGNALSINFLKEVEKFDQFMKYENGKWSILTSMGVYEELLVASNGDVAVHAEKASDVHGVGTGEVVGTEKSQVLTNKAMVDPIIIANKSLNAATGTIFKTVFSAVAEDNNDRSVYTTGAVYEKLKSLGNTDVGAHAILTNGVHGVGTGEVVGTENSQVLTNKNLKAGTKIFDGVVVGYNQAIAKPIVDNIPTTGEISEYYKIPSNARVYDFVKDLLTPVYANINIRTGDYTTLAGGDPYSYPNLSAHTSYNTSKEWLRRVATDGYYYCNLQSAGISVVTSGTMNIQGYDQFGTYNSAFDRTLNIQNTGVLILAITNPGIYTIEYESNVLYNDDVIQINAICFGYNVADTYTFKTIIQPCEAHDTILDKNRLINMLPHTSHKEVGIHRGVLDSPNGISTINNIVTFYCNTRNNTDPLNTNYNNDIIYKYIAFYYKADRTLMEWPKSLSYINITKQPIIQI